MMSGFSGPSGARGKQDRTAGLAGYSNTVPEPLNLPQPTTERRRFLEAMGVVTVGALTPSITNVAAAAAGSDFLLEPGLVYLNTGSVGPASRAVLDRTVEAWRELETNPVGMVYGSGASHRATIVRDQAAALLGCTADELLVTRSTTEAMNSVATGIRLDVRGSRPDH